eukprot:CAMPEP_0194550084 /NCGR_PEP_ID=MMETSP0253-20130528/95534_1 /TAXON_ID=2966 /ORGANISM="Noctiluca scintillans" /LENGTH=63 /DNA_ID=CAMNT_0039397519 /DNA_START=638 /DNA_END=829 /DNA_ORIENTATION=+
MKHSRATGSETSSETDELLCFAAGMSFMSLYDLIRAPHDVQQDWGERQQRVCAQSHLQVLEPI